jgi:glutaminyl-peptide cyclotransferase
MKRGYPISRREVPCFFWRCDTEWGLREIKGISRVVFLLLLPAGRPFLIGQTSHQTSANSPLKYTFAIARVFPHDTSACTRGLAYRDGFLYAGTGLTGRSSLRKVRLETGEVIQHVDPESEFFGEGITLVKNRVL